MHTPIQLCLREDELWRIEQFEKLVRDLVKQAKLSTAKDIA
jgi:hypothetical protein